MRKELIKRVHEIDKEGLRLFINVCRENNLNFFLRGGSVLGAIKYNGFIPWDDDIDVAMPRKDYEKLIRILSISKGRISKEYCINSYRYDKDFHCVFPRMSYTKNSEEGIPSNTKYGLHIMDIFPLDGAPDCLLIRMLYFLQVAYLRFLASLGTFYDKDMVNMHSFSQEFVIKIGRFFKLDKIISQRKVFEIQDSIYSKFQWNQSKYSGTLTGSKHFKEVMDTKVWGNGKKVIFEGVEVMIPYNYDYYLKRLYGNNYLTNTPKKKRSHIRW